MTTFELFQRFSVALAIGLLIGLERGWHEREGTAGSSAGLRTHALSALLGATWGAIANETGPSGAIALGICPVARQLTVSAGTGGDPFVRIANRSFAKRSVTTRCPSAFI